MSEFTVREAINNDSHLITLILMEMTETGEISSSMASELAIKMFFDRKLTDADILVFQHAIARSDELVDNEESKIFFQRLISSDNQCVLSLSMYYIAKKAVDMNLITFDEFESVIDIKYDDIPNEEESRILDIIMELTLTDIVEEQPEMIGLIENPSEKLQMKAIEKDVNSIQYIDKPSADVLLKANGII